MTKWFDWKLLREYLYFCPKIDFFPRGKSIVFGQKLPNFEVGIFQLFMSLMITACRETPLGIILSSNNALTKNCLFNSHHDFVFCGLFLFPWSLGRPKKCLRGCFVTNWFDWKLSWEYLYFVQKSTFFQGVRPWFLAKNGRIWKSAFFTCFLSVGISACFETLLGIIFKLI